MRFIFSALLLLIVPLSWSFSSMEPESAADPSTAIFEMEKPGKIWGKIISNKSGEPLAGANIFLKGTDFQVRTDKDGKYFVVNVPPGEYILKAEMMGYKSVVIKDVEVKSKLSTKVDFKLESVVINVGENEAPPPPPPPPPKEEWQKKVQEKLVQKGEWKKESDIPPPPPPVKGEEEIKFVEYDTPPIPVGGFKALQKKVVYPEAAKKSGVSGKVNAYVHINKKGKLDKIKNCRIFAS